MTSTPINECVRRLRSFQARDYETRLQGMCDWCSSSDADCRLVRHSKWRAPGTLVTLIVWYGQYHLFQNEHWLSGDEVRERVVIDKGVAKSHSFEIREDVIPIDSLVMVATAGQNFDWLSLVVWMLTVLIFNRWPLTANYAQIFHSAIQLALR